MTPNTNAASVESAKPFTAADIRDGDIIRVLPGTHAARVYCDPRLEPAVPSVPAHVHVITGDGVWTVPAALPVELVARHGNRRLVSLTKAWHLGPFLVGSMVIYADGPRPGDGGPALVYAVTRHVTTAEGGRYWLAAPSAPQVEVFGPVQAGRLRLARSRALEAIRCRGN
ncbi:hypothetical protein ACFOY4_01320 [Actinomadura syzygii]|uniref:Uncharacterized protein n=1 Tax=Actinomadura syzygii TaxID=1427538 RepID=A0A5D0TT42_9ACTN|nr:hypothetical protein [Actinomadura syzygii]TYC08610.1 hypothetical protein FXF65_37590 [Actinomadura syzygii]